LLHFGFAIFWQKNNGEKGECKMLMKLTQIAHIPTSWNTFLNINFIFLSTQFARKNTAFVLVLVFTSDLISHSKKVRNYFEFVLGLQSS